MARLHLFEFNDQGWLPRTFREAMTGYLVTLSRRLRVHERLAPVVERALRLSGAERIVDLCSGSGGPVLEIRALLSPRPPVVLTDKFPVHRSRDAVGEEGVTRLAERVDATAVPEHLRGLRTMFNAFHHFRPEAAGRVLADAVARRAPIVIVELSERTVANVVASPLILPLVLLTVPFLRPTRWQYWIFTYLLPVIPLAIFWDGLVSHLRAYSREELLECAQRADGQGYEWRVDRLPVGPGVRATVLQGIPG